MKRPISILKGEKGLSLIELLITMALVMIVLTMNTDTFRVIIRQSKQQAQHTAGAIDRIVGLEMLRMDAELAGFGLPWSFDGTASYSEAAATPQSTYNDAPSSAPRAIVTGNNAGYNNSDYLVIKSTAVGTSATSQKWTYITYGSATARTWGTSGDLSTGDRVTVIKPNATGGFDKQLVMDGTTMFTTVPDSSATIPSKFRPATASASYFVFGVDGSTDLRMPFNRADYFIARTAAVPDACAPGTGVLYKALINQGNGAMGTAQPVLDCVADMQVIFRLDTDLDGVIDTQSNDISTLTAQTIRQQVKEVRIYILSHEGERDSSFSYENRDNAGSAVITVGEYSLGKNHDLSVTVGSGWRNYRWKISTLVIRTKNILS